MAATPAGLALLVSRLDGIPLAHELGEDAWHASRHLSRLERLAARLGRRLQRLGRSGKEVTLVCGGEGFARLHQRRVDASPFFHITSLDAMEHRGLLRRAEVRLRRVRLAGGEVLAAGRSRERFWGVDRTVVTFFSESLRRKQLRRLARRRIVAPRRLARSPLGMGILVTDRHEWSTAGILEAARGRAAAGEIARRIADASSSAEDRWPAGEEPPLRADAFCCVIGRVLEKVVEMQARRLAGYEGSPEELMERLAGVREVSITEKPAGPGRPRAHRQLERMDGETRRLVRLLGVSP